VYFRILSAKEKVGFARECNLVHRLKKKKTSFGGFQNQVPKTQDRRV
jgi:hypothetical protein